jgi:hypothetical protein
MQHHSHSPALCCFELPPSRFTCPFLTRTPFLPAFTPLLGATRAHHRGPAISNSTSNQGRLSTGWPLQDRQQARPAWPLQDRQQARPATPSPFTTLHSPHPPPPTPPPD